MKFKLPLNIVNGGKEAPKLSVQQSGSIKRRAGGINKSNRACGVSSMQSVSTCLEVLN